MSTQVSEWIIGRPDIVRCCKMHFISLDDFLFNYLIYIFRKGANGGHIYSERLF